MQSLNFPTYSIRTRLENGIAKVFDPVRKRWILVTPEEWVRQHLIMYLHHEKNIPLVLMGIEKKLVVNGMTRRTDVVAYNSAGKPMLICECKAPDILLSQATMDQAARYNITLRVPYLLITNGLQHHCAKINHQEASYAFVDAIPSFEELNVPV